jgi:putative redox protein
MPGERFVFPGSQGHDLAARLDRPSGPARACALFAHCFTCGKDIAAASRIARALTLQGIAVLRFDFTGIGSSEGEFGNTGFSANVGDLLAAAEHLRSAHRAPDLLVGHSLGGAAVLAAAADIPEARAVATIGAPADPAHVLHVFGDLLERLEAGEAEAEDVTIAGRTFRIDRRFVEDMRQQRQHDRIANLRKALMVMHSPLDDVVGIDNASEIFLAARHPKSFVSLDNADHLLSRRVDAEYVANVLAAWASRYIAAGGVAATEVAPEPGAVVVEETGEGAFQQAVAMGPHRLLADEPERYGGTDTGGSPYDLLLAGLGACTSMTVRMYADRKKWPLERVRVVLRHEKAHAEDCEACETKSGKIDRIARDVAFTGELDADQRAKLLEIADKCPVHRTLHSEVQVDTRERPASVED